MGRAELTVSPTAVVAVVSASMSLVYLGVDALFGQAYYSLVNQMGPAALLAICFWAAYSLVREGPLAVWTPVPWFLAACAIYFGFGPLAYYFATPESLAFMDSYFPVDEHSLFRTNLLNSIGIASVCSAATLGTVALRSSKSASAEYSHAETKRIMWLFVTVGATVKYLFALPYALGLLTWVLPGSIQHLSGLLSAAIMLLFVIIHHGDRKYRWLLYPLIGSELVSSLITFAKIETILTVIAIVLARYLCRPNLKLLIGSGVAIILLYSLILSPFVSFARLAVRAGGGTELQQLAATVEEYGATDRDDLAGLLPGVQGWWTRLSYTNAQTFAMQAYDTGAPGRTFVLLPWVLVPRIVYPDKPVMTSGRNFDELVKGVDVDSSSGAGVFGEAYWNGGWAAVVGASLYLGILFVGFGRFATDAIAKQRYGYLPVVMIGVVMGLRPDDWFVPTYVGAVVEAIVLYTVLRLVLPLRFNSVSSRRPAGGTAESVISL